MTTGNIKDLKFNEVFTFEHLYQSYLKCCKGVNWKTSTKNFKQKAIQNVAKLHNELASGKYKMKKISKFTIKERGKTREIKALHIRDRIVQKCYCDYYLVPLLQPALIYDNGACLKGKGLSFSLKRIKAHLQKYYRQNNTNKGYILTFDFSKFFDSVNHELLINEIQPKIKDNKLLNLYKYFIESFGGEYGLGLGSQISQISILFFAGIIDHYLKDYLRLKYYGRYMDDGYIVSDSKQELQQLKSKLIDLSTKLKMKLNFNKTKIWGIDSHFMILHRHWHLTKSGYVKIKPSHDTMARLRKRFKKLTNKGQEIADRFKSSVNGFLLNFRQKENLKRYVYG